MNQLFAKHLERVRNEMSTRLTDALIVKLSEGLDGLAPISAYRLRDIQLGCPVTKQEVLTLSAILNYDFLPAAVRYNAFSRSRKERLRAGTGLFETVKTN